MVWEEQPPHSVKQSGVPKEILMKTRRSVPLFAISVGMILAPFASAVCSTGKGMDWPRFGGPHGTGVTDDAGWKPDAPGPEMWRRSVGLGYSAPSISEGRLYTVGFDEDESIDIIYCLDAITGEELWTHSDSANLDDLYHGGGSLSTPSVEGDLVYISNRDGEFLCLDAEDGLEVHAANLADDFELTRPKWGFSASPLVLEDRVVLNMGKVIVLDKESFEPLWVSRDFGHAYSTPVVFEHGGKPCLATVAGTGLAVLDLESGEELYHHPFKDKYDVLASTPVIVDDQVFISAGHGQGCLLVGFEEGKTKVAWENKDMNTHMNGCVLWEGHLYGFDRKILKCLDLDGKEMWRQRGLGEGTVVVANGHLLVLSEPGELLIAPASPEKFEPASQQTTVNGGKCWTTPVISHGLIYTRNSIGDLACHDYRGLGTE